MSRKYGVKKVISDGINNYTIGLLGESGIGKTTTIYEVCQKEFGDDGYLFINCGQESNIVNGIIETDAKDFKTVIDIVTDIVENRDTDYKDLKVIVFDTLDQLFYIAEQYAIAKWNKENATNPKFVKCKSLNGCYGGFGAGYDVVITLILNLFAKLKGVNITPWYIGHVKTKELTDPITGGTYTKLTTNMANRYFEAMKEKTNIIGIAAIDRTIEAQSTGRKNIVTHKDITVNRVVNERRKITFRDDNYSMDSKAHFEHIANEIPLDADEFIKALKDAIKASKDENSDEAKKIDAFNDAVAEVKAEIANPAPAVDEDEVDAVDVLDEDVPVDDDIAVDVAAEDSDSAYPEDLGNVVMAMVKSCKDATLRTELKKIMNGTTFSALNNEQLEKMYDLLNK